ncbi:MAG: DUF2662 domain-containing protein [Actinobacteria bacterium]|nr:DUF2662 domain-containing protein [Actinomycetota bacterium]
MVLRAFERRLEDVVEGTFARAFRSGLRPVEIGRKILRAVDDGRTVGVSGRTLVPNAVVVHLAPADAEAFAPIVGTLVRELVDLVRAYARDEGYGFLGPVMVEFTVDERRRTGTVAVAAEFQESGEGVAAGTLVLPGGARHVLTRAVVTVGRAETSDVQLVDPSVSRAHAEVRARGDGFVVVDLGSTNGTRVNGARVAECELRDGDEVVFGSVAVRFVAS